MNFILGTLEYLQIFKEPGENKMSLNKISLNMSKRLFVGNKNMRFFCLVSTSMNSQLHFWKAIVLKGLQKTFYNICRVLDITRNRDNLYFISFIKIKT